MPKTITLDDLITHIKSFQKPEFLRTDILFFIMENTEKWSLTIKSLLIKTPLLYISKSYILEKLDYCKNHPDNPYLMLDAQGMTIYMILLNRFAKEQSEKKFINHLDSYKELKTE